jgi:hypothetical protein
MGGEHETTLRQSGMTTKSPSAVEKKPEGGSVNSEPTRSSPAEQPPTLGPRSA